MNRAYYSDQICKDSTNRKLTGVCAGVANHYGKSHIMVRVITLCAFLILPGIVIGVYIGASLLLPKH
jgi:phage shock protein PspC (stress-responsive transcriptional regulator)